MKGVPESTRKVCTDRGSKRVRCVELDVSWECRVPYDPAQPPQNRVLLETLTAPQPVEKLREVCCCVQYSQHSPVPFI